MTNTDFPANDAGDRSFDFDKPVPRIDSDCAKWSTYPDDVLPLWVADMDFVSPQPILAALHDRVRHGVFGYAADATSLRNAICARLMRLQGWRIEPQSIVFLPGLVSGLNAVVRAIGEDGDGVMVNTPVYPPFLSAPENQRKVLHDAELAMGKRHGRHGQQLYYEPDLDRMEEVVEDSTKLYLLCNPHNPVGRAFTRSELESIGEFCLRHDIIICADEIHCELLMGDTSHTSIAALAPEIESSTITLISPSKTFNIPALGCSAAVIPNPELRDRFQASIRGIIPHVNVLGLVAAEAAYTECDEWLDALRKYLTQNRDFVTAFLREHLPEITATVPEATYLSWLDCRALDLDAQQSPCEFFLEDARLAFNDGKRFGQNGTGFVRMNFGCSRVTLQDALQRMLSAVRDRMPDLS